MLGTGNTKKTCVYKYRINIKPTEKKILQIYHSFVGFFFFQFFRFYLLTMIYIEMIEMDVREIFQLVFRIIFEYCV